MPDLVPNLDPMVSLIIGLGRGVKVARPLS